MDVCGGQKWTGGGVVRGKAERVGSDLFDYYCERSAHAVSAHEGQHHKRFVQKCQAWPYIWASICPDAHSLNFVYIT